MENSFQQWESGAVGFESNWRKQRKYSTSSNQTDSIELDEKGLQSFTTKHKGIQTDSTDRVVDLQENNQQPYPPSLYAFFAKVTDQVCRYLEDNLDPFASEVFKDFGEDENPQGSIGATKEFTLMNENVSSKEFGAKCAAWNNTGSQIAVGYSAHFHEGWCCDRVPLSVWNLCRSQNFNKNVPHVQVYLPSCISSMEFHPINPSIIAVGLYSGELALVDIFTSETKANNEEPLEDLELDLLGRDKRINNYKISDLGYLIDGSAHNNEITGLRWLQLTQVQVNELISKNKNPSTCCILTTGKDGFICLWSTNTSNTRLFMEKKFIAWSDNISDDIKIGNRIHLRMKEIGILGLSCCKDDPFTFICAAFGGFIFQGNIDGNIEAYTAMVELTDPDALNQETLFDPRMVVLAKNKGNTKIIDCSPFHRNIFLSATNNGDVYIQNLLQPMKSLLELYIDLNPSGTINDAKWSGRPSMFGVAFENTVNIFDLKTGNASVLEISHEEIVTNIAFNKVDVGLLATCDILGSVHIWKLPSHLSSHEPDELDVLIKLSKMVKPETLKPDAEINEEND